MVTFELPDAGRYGFALPADQINVTVKETIEGLTYLLKPKTAPFKKLGAFTDAEFEGKLDKIGHRETLDHCETCGINDGLESKVSAVAIALIALLYCCV